MIDAAIRSRTLDEVQREAAFDAGERPALIARGGSVSHATLDRRAEQLARAVAAHVGAGSGERVLLLLDDPLAQVAGIFAVLRAGHAFVPLDASHPPARLARLAAHADARLILTERALEPVARELGLALPVCVVEDTDAAAYAPLAPPRHAAGSDACILYTSGSTGGPKGVIHTHATLLHSFRNYSDSLGLGVEDRLAFTGSYAFAATLSDVFGATLNGAALTAHPLRSAGLGDLPRFLASTRTTVWFAVPSVFRRAVAALDGSHDLTSLRVLKLSGEPLRRADLTLFARHFPRNVRLLNSLGQTELNLVSQHFLAHGDVCAGELVPVGRPARDVEVRIVEPDGEGVGEIELVSHWLARGYWRDPELTAARFRVQSDGRRAFRSGDAGRLRDGVLEHLGRRDHQLKIGGVRVDPAEVEAALLACGAGEALALARTRPGGDAQLVAYVVPDPGAERRVALRASVAQRLPSPMVPSAVVGLPAWPMLPNGKIDRAALPAPEAPAAAAEASAARARDQLEDLVARTLGRVLGARTLGADEDFFLAGGDSLLAMTATLRLEQALGRPVPPALLLVARNARALAQSLREDAVERHWRTLVPLQARGDEPPLFCIHPHAGNVACYVALAGHLAPEIPVYGLQARGLSGTEAPHRDLDELASAYLAEIRSASPRGPYRLAGWCVGGLVALELAQRLTRAGERVELLVLCDVRLPARGWLALREDAREAGAGPALARAVLRGVRSVRRRVGRRAWSRPALLADRMTALVHDYRPAFYPGRVLVLESSDAPKTLRLRTRDWLRAAQAECLELAGPHLHVLGEPIVSDVAKLVRERLAR